MDRAPFSYLCLLIFSTLQHAPCPAHGGSASFVLPAQRPLVIAHRGSSGTLPEHTMRAYKQAIEDGADYIECDVVLTKDLVPVCIHEYLLDLTTDVAVKFPDRRRNFTDVVSGETFDDWFSFDFNLTEIKTLRKKQARSYRDPKYDGLYDIPTFQEFLNLARNHTAVGIYPEIKDPEVHNSLDIMEGKRFEDIVLEILRANNYDSADDLCFIQSFSEATTVYLSNRTRLPLVMLVEEDVTNAKLDEWRALGIAGIGPWLELISRFYTAENEYKNWISETTDFIERCHARGFKVHPWTLRNEDRFLAWDFQQDVHKAFDHFLALGVDGLFTDFPGTLASHLDAVYKTVVPSSAQTVTAQCTVLFYCVLVFTLVSAYFNDF